MFIKLDCLKLQYFFSKKNIQIIKLEPLENGFFKAVDSEYNVIYFYFQNEVLVFENYKDNPAILLSSGLTVYMAKNKIHRDNNLPAAFLENDFEMYFTNGHLHRNNDLPAIIKNWGSSLEGVLTIGDKRIIDDDNVGFKVWIKNGKIHRLNKAAIIKNIEFNSNNKPTHFYPERFFWQGVEYMKEDFNIICIKNKVETF